MIELATLHDALVGEIRDLYGAERQLLKALSRVAPSLRTAGMRDVAARLASDTGRQQWRLEQIFTLLDEDICSRRCLAMARILDTRVTAPLAGPTGASIDTALASQAQRAAHFLAVVHSTAAARARALGYDEVAWLLAESAAEATSVGRRLTTLVAPVQLAPAVLASARV